MSPHFFHKILHELWIELIAHIYNEKIQKSNPSASVSVIRVALAEFILTLPTVIMDWLNSYLDKRILELQQQTIKQKWQAMYLQDAVDSIWQKGTEKAPSDI